MDFFFFPKMYPFSLTGAGSKDHVKVQGEILEGLVARVVSHESLKHMDQVLRDFPLSPTEEGKQLSFLVLKVLSLSLSRLS